MHSAREGGDNGGGEGGEGGDGGGDGGGVHSATNPKRHSELNVKDAI